MRLRQFTLFSLLVASLYVSGCATALTVAHSPISETLHGDTVTGDPVGFNYAVSEEKNDLLLQKQPLCGQKIQLVEVKRKQLHGVIPAIVEMPLFGLGLLDLVVAGVYTKATVVETPGPFTDGPEVSICGDFEPASEQEVFVQYPVSITSKTVITDDKGRIPYKTIKPVNSRDRQFTVFIRENTGLTYVKTFENVSW
jgi:hypothetical protein